VEDEPMMSCREVSTVVSTGQMPVLSLRTRLGIWLHLSMCQHCRRFWRQLRVLDRAVRAIVVGFEREMPSGLEQRIAERLSRKTE
jgi:hypothetical protein